MTFWNPRFVRLLLLVLWILFLSHCASLFEDPPEREKVKYASTSAEEPSVFSKENLFQSSFQKKILVLPFLNLTPYGGDLLSNYATTLVKESVQKMDGYTPVGHEALEKHPNYMTPSGEFNLRAIYNDAAANDIAAVTMGTISEISFEQKAEEIGLLRTQSYQIKATVEFRIYDVRSETEIYSKTKAVDVQEERTRLLASTPKDTYDNEVGKIAVQKALEDSLSGLPSYARQIDWHGKIEKVDLKRFIIDAGESSGLKKGQILRVFEGELKPSKEKDKNLVKSPSRFKGFLRVVDHVDSEKVVAVQLSPNASLFEVNDRVEIFNPNKR